MANTQQGYVDVDGGRLYYETAGAGQALVLTHAAFLDSRMFDGMWPALAARFRVIRYDLRGFGRSSPANSPLCRRRDLEAVLNALDVERAHLVGCSNGGTLSLDLDGKPDILAARGRGEILPGVRWAGIVRRGLRDGRWNALPPGDSLIFGKDLGKYFEEPGIYRLSWKGMTFEAPEIVFRVLPRKMK